MTEAGLAAEATGPPRHGGIVDRIFRWVEALPGTAIPWIVGAVVALELLAHLTTWAAGETAVGEPRPELIFPGPFLAFFLLVIVVLDGVARSSFDDFRPSLD